MIIPFTVMLALLITWFFSALTLSIGVYIVKSLFNRTEQSGFWAIFPLSLLLTAVLTIVDWSFTFIFLPPFSLVLRIIIWFLLIMSAFKMKFIEALILTITLIVLKILFITFALTAIISIMV